MQGGVEFLAVTLWESIDAIKGFAGENFEIAVLEPEARAVLSQFDDFACHYEVSGDFRTAGRATISTGDGA
jgi:hypothetical protein